MGDHGDGSVSHQMSICAAWRFRVFAGAEAPSSVFQSGQGDPRQNENFYECKRSPLCFIRKGHHSRYRININGYINQGLLIMHTITCIYFAKLTKFMLIYKH